MEQGVIEGTTMSPELLVSRRYGDCLKYVTELAVQNTLFYCVINQDVYDSLPEDLRKVLDEVSGDFADKAFANYWESVDVEATKKWRADMGGKEFILFSDADYAKARELMQPPVDEWFESTVERCVSPARTSRRPSTNWKASSASSGRIPPSTRDIWKP